MFFVGEIPWSDMLAQIHQTYSPMPMCSDVNNCDIFLGGFLFALYRICFSVACLFLFSALLHSSCILLKKKKKAMYHSSYVLSHCILDIYYL